MDSNIAVRSLRSLRALEASRFLKPCSAATAAFPGKATAAGAVDWSSSDVRFGQRAAAFAALTAASAVALAEHRRRLTVQCEAAPAVPSSSSASSIINLSFFKDKVGRLAEVTDLLKAHGVDIREAKVSTDEKNQARHVYNVQDHSTGKGLSEDKLAEVRKALEGLGEVACTAESWPTYTKAQVAEHTTAEKGIWVTYKDGVYDITDFLANHPGGKDKIMLAAGKSVDPFWRIYQQHERRGTALTVLEKMRIGTLEDHQPQEDLGDDPYAADPERHPGLIYHNKKPCNAEVPPEIVMDNWRTPNSVWFIRHHHPVPVVDGEKYRLNIDGMTPVSLSLEDLKTRFLKREVTTTIQCGGNRRGEMNAIEMTSGIAWGQGAISNATWGGVYLREVLMNCAGVSLEGVEWSGHRHLVAIGMDDMQASIPIEKALSPFADVLLAYEMNGEPLPPEHGFPCRLIAPGVVGVRNVKWVTRIKLSAEEAEGPWQRGIAYKGFSPMLKDLKGVKVEDILSIQEMPVQSAILYPKPDEVIELDDIEVRGWAWSGGGRGIVRVDVSIDDGATWVTADLQEGSEQNPNRAWAWTFWECTMTVPEHLRGKKVTVLSKATDASYSTQPENPGPIWNLRGLNCNCWYRVQVQHKDDDDEEEETKKEESS